MKFNHWLSKLKQFVSFIILLTISANIHSVNACTVFSIHHNQTYIVGRNFDWPDKRAFILIHPIGSFHQSHALHTKGKVLSWSSKYGNATFNLTHSNNHVIKEAVMGGLNQCGLSVSALWLDKSSYTNHPKHPLLATGLWAQYFLDNAQTVRQAIALSKKITVEPTIFHGHKILLHLYLHDKEGHSAVMEYIKGKLRIHTHKRIPISVLTNNNYQTSLDFLRQYKTFGGTQTIPGDYSSIARFVRTAYFLKHLSATTSIQQATANAFHTLGIASQASGTSSPTVWSVVYNLTNQTIYYRTLENANIKYIRLQDFNFSRNQPIRFIRINNRFNGDIDSHFKELSWH